jgi:hypothetical protein
LEWKIGVRLERLKVLVGVVDLVDHDRHDDTDTQRDNAPTHKERHLAPAGGDNIFDEEIEHLR